jgi:predicted CXXCH cytochrome family protein
LPVAGAVYTTQDQVMPRRRSIRALSLRAAVALVLLASSLWTGCTTQKNYKVLSFFFDGVPDPNAPKLAPGQMLMGRQPGGAPIIIYGHKPYQDQNCDACHASGIGTVLRPESLNISSTVCLKCHGKIPSEFPVMHGPVATVECLWCHTPHEADTKALLKAHSPDVCLQCHSRELLDPNPPEHMVATASCLDCHFAHGATKHGLLRAGNTPTTLPAAGGGPS